MRFYESFTEIDAEPEAVWQVLVDLRAYPDWDSGVTNVEGAGVAREGSKLKVTSEISPDRAFPVKVSELIKDDRMVWLGGLPFGLFKAVRSFNVTPIGEGRTYFQMREVFQGPLLKVIGRKIPDLQQSFDQFTTGLEAEVLRRAQ